MGKFKLVLKEDEMRTFDPMNNCSAHVNKVLVNFCEIFHIKINKRAQIDHWNGEDEVEFVGEENDLQKLASVFFNPHFNIGGSVEPYRDFSKYIDGDGPFEFYMNDLDIDIEDDHAKNLINFCKEEEITVTFTKYDTTFTAEKGTSLVRLINNFFNTDQDIFDRIEKVKNHPENDLVIARIETTEPDDESLVDFCKENGIIIQGVDMFMSIYTGKRKHIRKMYEINWGDDEESIEYIDSIMRKV